MARCVISVNEALALIFADALEGDLEEFSDEDQPRSATESEEEQDSVVDNDGPPSQRRLAIESSDSTPIRQNTQPDPVALDSSNITSAFEVSIGAEPVPEVSDTLWDITTNSSVEDVSSLFVLGDLPVGQFEADCASIAMQSGVPISDDPVLIDSDESIQLQRKVRTHECSANCLQQFSNDEVLAAVWGICELSVEKNMLLLGKLITCSMNSKNRKGKEKKRMGHYYMFDRRRVCRLLYSS